MIGANSFFYEMTPTCMGGSNKNDIVACPGSVYTHLSRFFFFLRITFALDSDVVHKQKLKWRTTKPSIDQRSENIKQN